MSMSDQAFTKNFVVMIGGFIVLTVILLILAYIMAGPTTTAMTQMKRAEGEAILVAKMQPIGSISVEKAGEVAGEPVQVAAMSGGAVYASSCIACHGAGVAGAPKFGDAAQWSDRIAQGMETLVSNAINGYQGKSGYMPAKGGNAKLSDEEVTAAVEHMTAAVQ